MMPPRPSVIRDGLGLLLLPFLLVTGCGEEEHAGTLEPPAGPTGAIEVRMSTTGIELDPDGYLISFDSGPTTRIPRSGVGTVLDVPVGARTIAIADLAAGCRVLSHTSFDVSIEEGGISPVEIDVDCGGFAAMVGWTPTRFGSHGQALGRLFQADTVLAAIAIGIAPDGRSALFNGAVKGINGGFDLYSYPFDGSPVRRLTQSPTDKQWPALSPDGRYVAFAECEPQAGVCSGLRLRILDLQTGQSTTPFATGRELDMNPVFSPDARYVYFTRNIDWGYYLMRGDRLTGDTTIIDLDCWFYTGLSLSPDGTRLATACDRFPDNKLVSSIRIVPLNGAGAVDITENRTSADWFPAWSARGGYLLFQRGNAYGYVIYRVARDGTELTPLTSLSMTVLPLPLP